MDRIKFRLITKFLGSRAITMEFYMYIVNEAKYANVILLIFLALKVTFINMDTCILLIKW